MSELNAHVRSLEERAAAEKVNDSTDQPPEPYVVSRWHDDVMKFDGAVPGTDGVAVETALMRLAAKAPKDPTTGLIGITRCAWAKPWCRSRRNPWQRNETTIEPPSSFIFRRLSPGQAGGAPQVCNRLQAVGGVRPEASS